MASPPPRTVRETAEVATDTSRQAKWWMERVYQFGESQENPHLQFSSEVYVRHRMYTKRRIPIVRYIPGMLRLEKGEHNYLTEAQLRVQYRPPGETDCRVVAFCSTARYQNITRLNEIGKFNFFVYGTKLFIDRILNPINRRNRRFYHFTFSDEGQANDSLQHTVRIHVSPRFSNDQLVSGYIEVDAHTGSIRLFRFDLHYNLQRITVVGTMNGSGQECLLPENLRVFSRFRLLGNIVNEAIEMRSRHTFSCALPTDKNAPHPSRDLTSLCLLRIDTADVITSPAYMDSIRPFPLRGSEEDLINVLSSRHRHALNQYIDTSVTASHPANPFTYSNVEPHLEELPKTESAPRLFSEKTQNVLLSSHAFKWGATQRASIKLPPIFTPSMAQWSGSRGFSLRTRLTCEFLSIPGDDRPRIAFSPSIGYSFKQRQVYFNLPLYFRFAPQLDGLISVNAGGGNHMYNSRQADELREKLEGIEHYDSLLQVINRYGFHDYRDSYINADLSFSPTPGLRLQAGARYHRRVLIEWNDIASKGGLSRYLTSIGPRLEVEWTPAQCYYRQGRRRIPLYSQWPTFLFGYERGFSMGSGETRYERVEADVRYRLPLYAMRVIYFRAGTGLFTRKAEDCFLDYDYFRFNYMPSGWDDDLSGEFQLLSSRWYNESRYYVRFTGTYESPMLLFSRIPGLSRLVQKERCYLNLLSVRSLGFYSELGYGFSTHLIDLGAFIGIAPDRSVSTGCKFVLKFFED